MAFFRGEEGSVSFDNGTGSIGAIASTTAWTLDTTKELLSVLLMEIHQENFNFWFWYC